MTYTVPPGRYSDVNSAFVQAYIDAAIAGVIDLAPETLNSLNELAAAINDDPAFYATVAADVAELNTDVTALVTALGVAENDTEMGTFTAATLPDGSTLKAVLEAFASAYETTKSNLESADTTLSGRLDTLEADPTTQTVVDNLETALDGRLDTLEADPTTQTLLDAEETARENADSAIEGRLDTLEDDPTTQTLLDAETTTRANADSLLSGRLDVLEADPTTAAAVAAVQADVDQNESDADAALALKAPLADPTFTGDVSFGSLGRVNPSGNELKFLNDAMSSGIVLGNKITLQANSEVEVFGDLVIETGLTDAADDIAAAAAGVDVNQLYRNGSVVMIRVS